MHHVDLFALRDRAAAGGQAFAVRLHVDVPERDTRIRGIRSEPEPRGRMGRQPFGRAGRLARVGRGSEVGGVAPGGPARREQKHRQTIRARQTNSPSPNVTMPSAATFQGR